MLALAFEPYLSDVVKELRTHIKYSPPLWYLIGVPLIVVGFRQRLLASKIEPEWRIFCKSKTARYLPREGARDFMMARMQLVVIDIKGEGWPLVQPT